MIFDKLNTQNSIMETAMQASMVRKDVILNNIANVDTPRFKKKEVFFEESLSNALDKARTTNDFDFSGLTPKIQTVHRNFNYRIDENNVDIETEMVNLYENSIRYDVMANSVTSNYRRINMVLQSR